MAQKTNRFEGLNDDLAEFHIAKALLVRSESMFILFLGIALLLYFRLDPWIIPFGVVIHHTGDILVKRIKKPGESTSILMFILWAANIAV